MGITDDFEAGDISATAFNPAPIVNYQRMMAGG